MQSPENWDSQEYGIIFQQKRNPMYIHNKAEMF